VIGFLLDTTAVSELGRSGINTGLSAWIAGRVDHHLYISAPTVGELESGITRLPESARRRELERWLVHGILPKFGERVLPLDVDAARIWGRITGQARSAGATVSIIDAQIAAIAIANGLAVVTRNERDFKHPLFGALEVVNPWT